MAIREGYGYVNVEMKIMTFSEVRQAGKARICDIQGQNIATGEAIKIGVWLFRGQEMQWQTGDEVFFLAEYDKDPVKLAKYGKQLTVKLVDISPITTKKEPAGLIKGVIKDPHSELAAKIVRTQEPPQAEKKPVRDTKSMDMIRMNALRHATEVAKIYFGQKGASEGETVIDEGIAIRPITHGEDTIADLIVKVAETFETWVYRK